MDLSRARYLPSPRNLETQETQRNHRLSCYFGRFRGPRKRFKVDPTIERMYKQHSLEDIGLRSITLSKKF
ncbi:unnamed protein product [Hymenolepis diminuta]|uniref:Uncharacterized protein n=1 Tax=Hymenolepis diminuta TaxID=6216 RepID=A0A564YM94_HYMDI|nr:unnamed protein product [Hymenolepis diminuta]